MIKVKDRGRWARETKHSIAIEKEGDRKSYRRKIEGEIEDGELKVEEERDKS